MKPIFRSRALVICFAFLLGACQPAPDYTLDELVATLVDGAFCTEVELPGSGVADLDAATVPYADCGNEMVPSGLAVATFSSSDDRLFGILTRLDSGCDSEGEYVAYVFGDKWFVLTNGLLGESDMPKAEELLRSISNQIGGSGPNIIVCQYLQETLEPIDPSEIDAETLRKAFEE